MLEKGQKEQDGVLKSVVLSTDFHFLNQRQMTDLFIAAVLTIALVGGSVLFN